VGRANGSVAGLSGRVGELLGADWLINAWFEAEHRHFPAWRARQITFAEQRRRRLRDFLPLIGVAPGDDENLDEVFKGYLERYEVSWTKFDDVEPTLAMLANSEIKIAVLSTGTLDQQTAKIEAVGVHGQVGPLFTADELGAAKPDPSTYLAADDSTVMIDEPELSMHVDWQQVLVASMRRVNPDCQLLLATHSPEVMADVADDKVFEL
jgi:putative hydrolase of the HAD superfamily